MRDGISRKIITILRHFVYFFKTPGRQKHQFIKTYDCKNFDKNRAWQIITPDIFSLGTYGAIWEIELNLSVLEKMTKKKGS